MDKTTQIVFLVFTAAIALGVLIQACAIVAMFITARKTRKKIHALVEDFRLHVLPLVSTSRTMVEDLTPKLKIVSSNLVETSNKVRAMAEDVSGVVGDVSDRTKAQAAHVDGMVQGTLDQITQAGQTLQHGISIPLRQLTGIVNGLRAGLNVLWQKAPTNHRESESDIFN